ncbi:hypothetical protein OM076_00550 [Solirubrobacter ginsenosidimutans]|uniref:Uncharacterized protein n=1 Tax=Solirubrobacter ginsenosidimutans TaxID=490573 RepID=A0A9X3MLF8_9ACTN|nr:hypothetical protein [Solirubrobacter ginsenosidimutans]MDA0158736.1 hypothetical protein [Solirubrobacter ginsenosidimutans]
MKVLIAIGLVIAVFGVGSGLAALPVTVNEPCSTWYGANEADAWRPQAATNLVPLGTRCEYPPGSRTLHEDHVPSTFSYAAWLVVVAASCAFTVSRWCVAALRGAACALLIAGLFGLLYVYWGEYTAAAFSSCVLGAPLVFALDVRARADLQGSLLFCLALPVIANAAWFVPGLLGAYAAAAACVALGGALASFALDQASRSFVAGADVA